MKDWQIKIMFMLFFSFSIGIFLRPLADAIIEGHVLLTAWYALVIVIDAIMIAWDYSILVKQIQILQL